MVASDKRSRFECHSLLMSGIAASEAFSNFDKLIRKVRRQDSSKTLLVSRHVPGGTMSEPTRLHQPIIMIRGFGGLDTSEEKRNTYQGFNDGTVYPQKQGDNYIYEGLILRFMKSADWQYQDATNVVSYYRKSQQQKPQLPEKLQHCEPDVVKKFENLQELGYFSGHKVVINPSMALYLLETMEDPWRSLWVFRYYDLDDREFELYGEALVRLIDFIRDLTEQQTGDKPKVNIIAHSMGGLIVREAIQHNYPNKKHAQAEDYINKIVTLGTPHKGISFQVLGQLRWLTFDAEDEIKRFDPQLQEQEESSLSYKRFHKCFPLERLLTVVGTNYRSYNIAPSSWANRLFSVTGEFGPNYNRSDGLVKHSMAEIPGTPRTFINKCHGGFDSLITSREAFEIARRFFFGNMKASLRFVEGKVTRGKDLFGKSEFFLGVSIKPRGVDFELFHQSKEAENCYDPFSEADAKGNVNFNEQNEQLAFPWADDHKLIWEGYLDNSQVTAEDLVIRLDFYVSERDLFGIGFSDNVVFSKQYYIRALLPTKKLYLYNNEKFNELGKPIDKTNGGWEFSIGGEDWGFEGTFRVELENVPEIGKPQPFGNGVEEQNDNTPNG